MEPYCHYFIEAYIIVDTDDARYLHERLIKEMNALKSEYSLKVSYLDKEISGRNAFEFYADINTELPLLSQAALIRIIKRVDSLNNGSYAGTALESGNGEVLWNAYGNAEFVEENALDSQVTSGWYSTQSLLLKFAAKKDDMINLLGRERFNEFEREWQEDKADCSFDDVLEGYLENTDMSDIIDNMTVDGMTDILGFNHEMLNHIDFNVKYIRDDLLTLEFCSDYTELNGSYKELYASFSSTAEKMKQYSALAVILSGFTKEPGNNFRNFLCTEYPLSVLVFISGLNCIGDAKIYTLKPKSYNDEMIII